MNPREVAEQIVRKWTLDDGDDALMSAIESALLAERERCAKIAENQSDGFTLNHASVPAVISMIADAIRSDKEPE